MRDLLYFDAMITPKIITFIYWLLLAAIALGGLAMLGVGFSRGFGAGMASLLVAPIVVALWALMARTSRQALADGTEDRAFHETKIATGRYYMARHLPACGMHLARIQSGADPVMALAADQF